MFISLSSFFLWRRCLPSRTSWGSGMTSARLGNLTNRESSLKVQPESIVSAKFYLVAMFFVIFDLEAVFIFAWAIAARELGWAGYCEILVFIAILLAALAYLWRLGALDWSPSRRTIRVRH